jgi:hypothetical protein
MQVVARTQGVDVLASVYSEFVGANFKRVYDRPLTSDADGSHTIPTTGTASAYFLADRCGALNLASLLSRTALALDAANYVTVTVDNLGPINTPDSNAAMLAVSDANTTKLTTGTAISANIPRSLTLHGTASHLSATRGDVVRLRVANNGTLSVPLFGPEGHLEFATIDAQWNDRIVRTNAHPTVLPGTSVANGTVGLTVSAANEAQVAGLDWGDQRSVVIGRRPIVEGVISFTSLPSANQRVWFGALTTFDPIFANIPAYVMFQIEGAGGALLIQSDDGVHNEAAQATGITLAINTPYHYRIDMSDLTACRFIWAGAPVGIPTDMSSSPSGRMQPGVYAQKDSGASSLVLSVDLNHNLWSRA